MDLQRTHAARARIADIVAADQEAEAQAVTKMRDVALDGYRRILHELGSYLYTFQPSRPPTSGERSIVASISTISLEDWIVLQSRAATLDAQLGSARAQEATAKAYYGSKVGILGGGFSRLFSDAEGKAAIDEAREALKASREERAGLERELAAVLAKLKGICTQFLTEASGDMARVCLLPTIGARISAIQQRVLQETSEIWGQHCRFVGNELDRITKLVAKVRAECTATPAVNGMMKSLPNPGTKRIQ